MNTTQTNQLTKLPELDSFAMQLKANGFTVILSKEPTTYFHFFKDGKMGYIQKGYYSGYDYSTTHKPCRDFGTGFSVLSNVMELSIENANKCLKPVTGWAGRKRGQTTDKIQYYASAEDYINAEKWAKYYIL